MRDAIHATGLKLKRRLLLGSALFALLALALTLPTARAELQMLTGTM